MRLIDEWVRFDQSIVNAAIDQWVVVSALVSVERGTLWAPNIKFQLFCCVSTKVIKLVEIRQSSGIFHNFSLETVKFSTFVFYKVVQ